MGSGILKLENRVKNNELRIMTSKTELSQMWRHSYFFVNLSWLGIFNQNIISELSKLEMLSLFNNTKIPQLRNSGI